MHCIQYTDKLKISIILSHLTEDEAGRCRATIRSFEATAARVSASVHLQQENELLINLSLLAGTGAPSYTIIFAYIFHHTVRGVSVEPLTMDTNTYKKLLLLNAHRQSNKLPAL